MVRKKGIHANERSGLRPLKTGETVAYGGGGFHIVKKKERDVTVKMEVKVSGPRKAVRRIIKRATSQPRRKP